MSGVEGEARDIQRPERTANRRIFSDPNRKTEVRESRIHRAIELFLREPPGLLVDVGCGDGAIGGLLEGRGWRVMGLDIAEARLRDASRLPMDLVVADVGGVLPLRSGTADAVFAGEVIEHLVDTDAFLAELWRVLRQGGLLVLTTPNLASFENRVRLLLGKYPIWVDWRLGGEGHVRAYTPKILKDQMREHRFRVQKLVGNWVPLLPQRWADDVRYPWLARTGKWAPNLSMDIIVSARKVSGTSRQAGIRRPS